MIRAFLFKDRRGDGDLDRFYASATESLRILGALASPADTTGTGPFRASATNAYEAQLAISNFLLNLSGEVEILERLLPEIHNLPLGISIPVLGPQHGAMQERSIIVAARRLLEKVRTEGATWIRGRSRVVAERGAHSIAIRLTYLDRDLVGKKVASAHLGALEVAARHLEGILRQEGNTALADQLAEGLRDIAAHAADIRAIVENYLRESHERLLTARTGLRQIREVGRADLADEALIMEIESISALAGDVDDMTQERRILERDIIAPLTELLTDPDPTQRHTLRGRALVAAWKVLADNIKRVAGIVRDQNGFTVDDASQRRRSIESDTIFVRAREMVETHVVDSGRADLRVEGNIILNDIVATQAGDELRPRRELEILREARDSVISALGGGLLAGRLKKAAELQVARLGVRMGALWRQMEGRHSRRGLQILRASRDALRLLTQSDRGDIGDEARMDLALMRFLQAADPARTRAREPQNVSADGHVVNGKDQRAELEVLHSEVRELLERVMQSGRMLGRPRITLEFLAAQNIYRQGLIQREIEGRDDPKATRPLEEADRQMDALVRTNIPELTDEIRLMRLRLELIRAGDTLDENEERERILAFLPRLEDLRASKQFSSRARTEFNELFVQAKIREGFLRREFENRGTDAALESLKARITELHELFSGLSTSEERRRPGYLRRIESRRTSLTTEIITWKSDAANASVVAMGEGLRALADLLVSGRSDLVATAHYWLGQLAAVIAENDTDLLDIALMHLEGNFQTGNDENYSARPIDELRGIQMVTVMAEIGKIHARKAGIENENLLSSNPYSAVAIYLQAVQARDRLVEAYQFILERATGRRQLSPENVTEANIRRVPREQLIILAELDTELANLLPWGVWDLERAEQYYGQAIRLIEIYRKPPGATTATPRFSRDAKLEARARIGLGDLAAERFGRVDLQEAEWQYRGKRREDGTWEHLGAEQILAEINPPGGAAISQSLMLLRARLALGFGRIYGSTLWNRGGDRERSERYLDEAREILERVTTNIVERNQIQRVTRRALSREMEVLRPRLELRTYAGFQGDRFTQWGTVFKTEVPFGRGRYRLSAEVLHVETGTESQTIPFVSGSARWGNYQTGTLDLGAGTALFNIFDVTGNAFYNYNDIFSLSATARGIEHAVPADGEIEMERRPLFFGAVGVRPLLALSFLKPRLADIPILRSFQTGIEGLVYPNWGSRNYTASLRWAGSLNIPILQENLEFSGNFSYPFAATTVGPDPAPAGDPLRFSQFSYGFGLRINPAWILDFAIPGIGRRRFSPRLDLFWNRQTEFGDPRNQGTNIGATFSTPF